MTIFTSSRRKTARRFIKESTDRYQASSTYGWLLDINEQQDGTCLKKGSTTGIIFIICFKLFLERNNLSYYDLIPNDKKDN